MHGGWVVERLMRLSDPEPAQPVEQLVEGNRTFPEGPMADDEYTQDQEQVKDGHAGGDCLDHVVFLEC